MNDYGDYPNEYVGCSSEFAAFVNPNTNQCNEDEIFVNAWLSKIKKTNLRKQASINKNKNLNISCVKSALQRCLILVEKLESTQSLLQENVSMMSSDDWKRNTEEIGSWRDELNSLMLHFQNDKVLEAVKCKLMKRSRRRLRARESKVQIREDCKKAHERIDHWLENMKDKVERVKAEEDMKKDADCVLSEVTKKKSDARKHLNLVAALVKLRDVREAVAVQRGAKSNAEDRAAFFKTCGKLKEMWESSSRTYAKEEQGLKIMLEQSDEKRVYAYAGKEKRTAQEWEAVLFGDGRIPGNPVYWGLTAAERDFETFIAIRKSWDTFLTSDETDGSKIPIGWVLPPAKADDIWTQYLHT